MSLVVRARDDTATVAPAVRQAIWSVDNDQPVARVATMETLLAASASERRFALILFEAFAIAALVVGLLMAVSAIACSVPTWRAARVDPAITLRCGIVRSCLRAFEWRLGDQAYVDLISYLLKVNGNRAGESELKTDVAELETIIITDQPRVR
jgi:hypothetical protein